MGFKKNNPGCNCCDDETNCTTLRCWNGTAYETRSVNRMTVVITRLGPFYLLSDTGGQKFAYIDGTALFGGTYIIDNLPSVPCSFPSGGFISTDTAYDVYVPRFNADLCDAPEIDPISVGEVPGSFIYQWQRSITISGFINSDGDPVLVMTLGFNAGIGGSNFNGEVSFNRVLPYSCTTGLALTVNRIGPGVYDASDGSSVCDGFNNGPSADDIDATVTFSLV